MKKVLLSLAVAAFLVSCGSAEPTNVEESTNVEAEASAVEAVEAAPAAVEAVEAAPAEGEAVEAAPAEGEAVEAAPAE